jgi:hypothetical protein
LAIAFLLPAPRLNAWGFAAHRKIIDAAIHWLPPPLHSFFKSHHQWLNDHALDADLRKHTVQGESQRHYIDLDRYGPTIDSLRRLFPMDFDEAIERWTEDSLQLHGIGPWNAFATYKRLVRAFDAKSEQAILRAAVDLAHYIGDLHVPLHTCSNYNGKATGQAGIHALWETQLPEAFMQEYTLHPGGEVLPLWRPELLNDLWEATLTSHECLELVFKAEWEIRQTLVDQPIDAYVQRGRTRQLMRSPEFVSRYHEALGTQVETRMRLACQLISASWYSAWVEAGEPPLPRHEPSVKSGWKKVVDWLLK